MEESVSAAHIAGVYFTLQMHCGGCEKKGSSGAGPAIPCGHGYRHRRLWLDGVLCEHFCYLRSSTVPSIARAYLHARTHTLHPPPPSVQRFLGLALDK